jgi:hypothetical protein
MTSRRHISHAACQLIAVWFLPSQCAPAYLDPQKGTTPDESSLVPDIDIAGNCTIIPTRKFT